MLVGKWISGLNARMPLVEAAKLALPARFDAVRHYLPLASKSAAKDIEHVHQLRVASRRAAAALNLFTPCLPEKFADQWRKLLRAIRRSAGDARDWDVFYLMLQDSPALASEPAAPTRDFLLGVAAARRMHAQEHLIDVAARKGQKLAKQIGRINERDFNWQNEPQAPTLGELASVRIQELLQLAKEHSAPPPAAYHDLHQFRILGKRLRYTIEICADCLAESFRAQLYPAVEEMQETLGRITDAHVATERIVQIRDHLKQYHRTDWPRYQKALELLTLAQRRVLPRERKRFLAWLPNWRQLTGT